MVSISQSLGDLWSYNTKHDAYRVSPIPDLYEYIISPDHDYGNRWAVECFQP